MSTLLNKDEYTVDYDKLISSGKHPVDVTIVNVESGQGVLKRGTVLSHVVIQAVENIDGFDGYRVLGTNMEDAKFVIAEDVDTTSNAGNSIPVTVYKSGGFNAGALIAEPGYTIPARVYETLRTVGIYID